MYHVAESYLFCCLLVAMMYDIYLAAESVSSDGLTGQWQQQLIQLRKQQLLQELLQQKAELQVSLEKNVRGERLGDKRNISMDGSLCINVCFILLKFYS